MRNWGVGLVICGALVIVGLIAEPEEYSSDVVVGALGMILGGGYLANKGQKYLNLMREVSEESLN